MEENKQLFDIFNTSTSTESNFQTLLDASNFQNGNYSDVNFIEELKSKLAMILRTEFPSIHQKQTIREDMSGFNISCPYCGDSLANHSKKRGHLILKDSKWVGYYKCFNCNKFTTIPKFFSDFKKDLSLDGVMYVNEHIEVSKDAMKGKSSAITADVFQKSIALEYGIPKSQLKEILRLYEIDRSQIVYPAYNYLTSRNQWDFSKFLYEPKSQNILILNMADDKVIGMQTRSINPNTPKDRRFMTFTLDRLYKRILRNTTVDIPEKLNTLSTVFNIFSINIYSPIIVTEGPMDAFLLPNAIASSGANKNLPIELPFYYLYDADATGKKHAIEKLKQKQKVFLWGKFKKDYNLPMKEKWDVNDCVNYIKNKTGHFVKINWHQYFSDNILDMIFIDDLSVL